MMRAGLRQDPAPVLAPRGVQQLIDEGFGALEAGDVRIAQQRFEQATDLSPDSAPAWLGLAECRRIQGENLRALRAARKAQAVSPQLAAASFAIARILLQLGSPGEALGSVRRARELDPENVDILLFEALLLRDEGHSAEAAHTLDDAWQAGLDAPRLAEELALLLAALGQSERAIEIVEASLGSAPGRPVLQFVKGLLLARDPDRQTQAEGWLRQALHDRAHR